MWTIVPRRVAQAGLTLLAAAVLVWAMLLAAPGDPARHILAAQGIEHPLPAQVAETRKALGLDDAPPRQLARWLAGALRGDLGTSWRTGRPVSDELAQRLPATARLAVVALALAALGALPFTLLGVAWRDRVPDLAVRGGVFVLAATPTFVVGILLLDVVVVRLRVGQVIADGSWRSALLPAVPLALTIGAQWSRVLRTALVDALAAPHLHVAQARGASQMRLLAAHALPNAAPPLLTTVGMTIGGLLAGAAVVETLFTWPGIGRHLVEAIAARDVPVVQGFVLFGVLTYVIASLAADLVSAAVDPRLTGRTP